MDASTTKDIAQAMAASVAPVFLISGIGVLLSTMSIRYGRVIDRTRKLLREGNELYTMQTGASFVIDELKILYQRAWMLRATLVITSLSSFCVVLTVFVLFADFLVGMNHPNIAAASFLTSLVFLIVGVLLYIHDFMVSLKTIRKDIKVRASQPVFEDEN